MKRVQWPTAVARVWWQTVAGPELAKLRCNDTRTTVEVTSTRVLYCFVTNPKNLPAISLYHILITANMQWKTGFPSSHQLKSYTYVAPKSRLKFAARCPENWRPFCSGRRSLMRSDNVLCFVRPSLSADLSPCTGCYKVLVVDIVRWSCSSRAILPPK